MRALWIVAPCLLAVGGGLYVAFSRQSALPPGAEVTHLVGDRRFSPGDPGTSAGLCPWRSPEQDRARFFRHATGARDETLILSRNRLELERRLGRKPGADDAALIVHRILGPSVSPGVVITRRVRGECGLIELVLAADIHGRVLGARIQRQREPEITARALQSEAWLAAFRGRDSGSPWTLGMDIPAVPAEARASAQAVLREARTVLVMLDVALKSDSVLPPDPARGPLAGG